jgi:hypothetical protein
MPMADRCRLFGAPMNSLKETMSLFVTARSFRSSLFLPASFAQKK